MSRPILSNYVTQRPERQSMLRMLRCHGCVAIECEAPTVRQAVLSSESFFVLSIHPNVCSARNTVLAEHGSPILTSGVFCSVIRRSTLDRQTFKSDFNVSVFRRSKASAAGNHSVSPTNDAVADGSRDLRLRKSLSSAIAFRYIR